ncbi:hypothetical protein M5K25_026579 [Dendrobium thyrsiflorum]|uniref:Uncharacterized protein n=1 Tax=Dendrobium thyrsiflorum TaxID=117978 RepID=A0ABD0TXN5_DENTH
MARKGNQPRNGFDRKTDKLQNVIPRSLDPSFVESKEKKGKSDQNFTSCDQSNGDFPFRSSNPFPEQAINTESTGTVRSCKQRISDVHLREKSGNRTQSSAQAGMSIKVVDIAEHDLLSDASELTESNGLMLDYNSNLSKNLFGSFSVRSALDFVGSLDAISGWSFRSASYALKLASGWIEHQKPRFSPFISYMHSIYDYGIARIKFVYPVICTWILHLGKLVLFLSAIWLDYSIRGLTSLLHLGTASLFTVLWCSLLSIIGMVGFIKLLIMVCGVMYQTLITNPYLSFVQMERHNTPMTVQLGQGARIQLANAIIETGNVGATIQFGSLDFPAVVARTAVAPVSDMDTGKPARRLHPSGAPTRRTHLPAQRPIVEEPSRRTSVFERLSQSEVPTIKRTLNGGRISVVTANTTSRTTGLSAPREYDPETSSSRGRLTRRQRRKRNAELRAQQQFLTHPSNVPAQELEATIPTRNGFSNLKWVKRNSSSGELKKSFWEQRREVPTPPKKRT